jgi:uncharacterized protein
MKMVRRLILNPGVIVFAVLYLAGLVILSQNKDFNLSDALVELIIIGLVFPLLAWIATRRAVPLTVLTRSSGSEILVLIATIVALSIYLVDGPQLIDGLLPAQWSVSPRIHFFVNLAKKLAVFVVVPWLIFRFLFGYRWRDYGVNLSALRALGRGHGLAVLVLGGALILFQYFLGRAAAPLRAGKFSAHELLPALPVCFVWLSIEAGLVEEFFFRALVQSRLSAFFRSEITAVALMSLTFGLAHAPGFIFRHGGEVEGLGANPSALNALAYSTVVVAPSGILFGVIWARTRNLFVAVLVHAAGDLLPNLPAFIDLWR